MGILMILIVCVLLSHIVIGWIDPFVPFVLIFNELIDMHIGYMAFFIVACCSNNTDATSSSFCLIQCPCNTHTHTQIQFLNKFLPRPRNDRNKLSQHNINKTL